MVNLIEKKWTYDSLAFILMRYTSYYKSQLENHPQGEDLNQGCSFPSYDS